MVQITDEEVAEVDLAVVAYRDEGDWHVAELPDGQQRGGNVLKHVAVDGAVGERGDRQRTARDMDHPDHHVVAALCGLCGLCGLRSAAGVAGCMPVPVAMG